MTVWDHWDLFYLGMAKYVSQKSKDPSTKTGAVIVRPDRTLASIGFNGFPQGMLDTDAHYADRTEKLSRIVHCEMNAVLFAREPLHGHTLYTWPFGSCDRCAVHMIQSGVSRFVFPELEPDKQERWGSILDRAKQYLNEANKTWVEIPREELRDISE